MILEEKIRIRLIALDPIFHITAKLCLLELKFTLYSCRIVMGSEKAEVEKHTELLCLDDDLDILYSLLKKTEKILTKEKVKKLIRYTINLDTGLRKSIAQERSRIMRTISNRKQDGNEEHVHSYRSQSDRELPLPAGIVLEEFKRK